jgi:hypothetical protein
MIVSGVTLKLENRKVLRSFLVARRDPEKGIGPTPLVSYRCKHCD